MNTLFTPETHSILVEVDVQRDFVDGSLAVPDAAAVIPLLNSVAAATRASSGDIVFTRDWHPATTPHFDMWPKHCIQHSSGADLDARLEFRQRDYLLSKGQGQMDGYSGIEATDDEDHTIESIIDASNSPFIHVYIGGLATDYCVKATAIDLAHRYANQPHIQTFLLLDAVRAVNLNAGDETKALQAIYDANVSAITSEQAIKQIKGVNS